MKNFKRSAILCAVMLAALCSTQCKNSKHIANAKGNSVGYGKARCECEKQKKKVPPGSMTKCLDDMARMTRYLKINFEFNSFGDDAKREITKAGDDAFAQCMAE